MAASNPNNPTNATSVDPNLRCIYHQGRLTALHQKRNQMQEELDRVVADIGMEEIALQDLMDDFIQQQPRPAPSAAPPAEHSSEADQANGKPVRMNPKKLPFHILLAVQNLTKRKSRTDVTGITQQIRHHDESFDLTIVGSNAIAVALIQLVERRLLTKSGERMNYAYALTELGSTTIKKLRRQS